MERSNKTISNFQCLCTYLISALVQGREKSFHCTLTEVEHCNSKITEEYFRINFSITFFLGAVKTVNFTVILLDADKIKHWLIKHSKPHFRYNLSIYLFINSRFD